VRLVECWRSAIAADDAGWRHTARISLAAWARQHVAPSRFLSIGEPPGFGVVGPGGRMVLFLTGDTARLLDTTTGRPVGLPMRHEKISGGVFSHDGKAVLTVSRDGTARPWDAATGKPLGPPLVHQRLVLDLAFSPDRKTIFTRTADGTVGDGTARLWDAATGQPVAAPFRHLDARISGVASFNPDGKAVLTVSRDGTARLWDAAIGRPLGPPLRHQSGVSAVAFSPDGRAVLTGSGDGTARLWDTATGRPLGSPLRHQGALMAVAFSRDGTMAVTSSHDKTAGLWDVATGQPLRPPLRNDRVVYSVAFSPDSKAVVIGSSGETARLWEVAGLPDDPERVTLWIEAITGLALDGPDPGGVLEPAALGERRERLAKLGGPPMSPPRWSLDPVLFGPDPASRAWAGRRRWVEAEAAFDEALRARPLQGPLWAESARFHADRGGPERAAEDAARAVLLYWGDPGLADLAHTDAAFRAESLEEIRAVDIGSYRTASDVWRGRGRRRASRGDWVGAAVDFARPATPAFSLSPPHPLTLACLLRLAGDRAGTSRFADEFVRRMESGRCPCRLIPRRGPAGPGLC
jgi:hypothetical protein